MPPLSGLKVLDFSTLLPGPLASLLLAEAGAEVVKVERPGGGDEMRSYAVPFGQASANFAMLNRGKASLVVDLKDPAGRATLAPYLDQADVLIEQFRPGVMERLGLGWPALHARHPRLIYCSITGHGQDGPRRDQAGHDLNYLAETGILGLTRGADGAPVLPPVLAGDIAGGAYPAVMNILLALRERDAGGLGRHLDIAMAPNLLTFAYWGLGAGFAAKAWPRPGAELVTGGSPRYHIYRTADDRFLACAPLEERFWTVFCDAIGLPPGARDDAADPEAVTRAVAALVRTRDADDWLARLAGRDVCVTVVASLEEAACDPDFARLFGPAISDDAGTIPALPVAVAPSLRVERPVRGYARLGAANDLPPWSGDD